MENNVNEEIELQLHTQKTNAGAFVFYHKLGFEVQNTKYISL